MACLNNHGSGRDITFTDRLVRHIRCIERLERALLRLWHPLPLLLQVVILHKVGLLPSAAGIVRLVETLGR